MIARRRSSSLVFSCGAIVLGLASRRFASSLPPFVAAYAGDTLWAAMVFLGIAFLAPRASTAQVSIISLCFSWIVEVSQSYRAPWIDDLRASGLGRFVLGQGFLWSDLVCYTVGVMLMAACKCVFRKKRLR